MMQLKDIQNVYFLGIGGIGMSALARYFNFHGCTVSGFDKTATPLTKKLEEEGIHVFYSADVSRITADIDLIIFTPAVSQDHAEWEVINKLQIPVAKRAFVLGLIANSGINLAVAGTHGKTTTSAILTHILKDSLGEVNAFVGGVMSNYNTNFLYGANSDYHVVEADEFDRSFLHLTPKLAIINSMDADHLDIYGGHDALIESFQEFANKIYPDGVLVVKKGLEKHFKCATITFGKEEEADYYIHNIRVSGFKFSFNLRGPSGDIKDLTLGLPGVHNIENATAALIVALNCGVEITQIKKALANFKGVKRRFEMTTNQKGQLYVDDYAHHPEEISQVHDAVRLLAPGKHVKVVFQPHLFSRTRDFESEFAHELAKFDSVDLLDIYPARELPIDGVSSTELAKKIKNTPCFVVSKKAVVEEVQAGNFEVLLTLGAGDIDTLVEPIKNAMGS